MFYLIYGDDVSKRTAKARALITAMQKKRPDAEIFSIEGAEFEAKSLPELVLGQGLFERKFIIRADRCFTNEMSAKLFQESLKELGQSENVFVFVEESLKKPLLKKITPHAEDIFHFESVAKSQKTPFNMFALTDAFGRRDKKSLWVLYRRAIKEGSTPQEVHGILFWQLKSITLASGAKTANEVGMKPFPFQKAKGFSKNFQKDELPTIRSEFIALYHDARRGLFDLEEELERFILQL